MTGVRHNMHALVGRDQEQAAFRETLEQMLHGDGRLLLMSGEAGIGKSSLVEEFAREAAARDSLVLRGYCYDLSTTPPYGLWLEMTDRYPDLDDLPALPDLLKRGTGIGDLPDQFALFELVRAFLQSLSREHPVVVILEDIHWADQASLELLRYLARHISGWRILLIATYRDDEVTTQHRLFPLLPNLIRESGAIRVEPGLLPEEALDRLVSQRWNLSTIDHKRLVRYLLEHAEGQPLFTIELMRTLEQEGYIRSSEEDWQLGNLSHVPVPALVQQIIERRLSLLDEESQRVLEVAAVIGQQVSLDIWQQVSGMSDHDMLKVLEQAINLHLLEQSGRGNSVAFVHAITREALYERILLPRARRLHCHIAETLEQTSFPVADVVAYHYQRAGDERAVEWLIEAGESAFRNHAWTIAAERFETAALSIPDIPERARERGWLLYRVGHLLRYAEPEYAIEVLENAFRVGREIDDDLLSALATLEMGVTYCNAFEIRRGVELLRAGTELWEALPPDCREVPKVGVPTTARGPGQYILWLGLSGDYRQARVVGERCLSPDGQASRGGAGGLWGLATAYQAMGLPEQAATAYTLERESFVSQNDYQNAGRVTFCHLVGVAIPYFTERLEDRRHLAELASEYLGRGRGAFADEGHPQFPFSFGPIMWLEGQWHDLAAMYAGLPFAPFIAPSQLAQLNREQGNWDQAWQYTYSVLKDGPATRPGDSEYHQSTELQREAVKLALSQGNLESAHAWLQSHEDWLEWGGSVYGRAEQELLRARLTCAHGDVRTAEEQGTEALRLACDPRQPLVLIDINLFLGELTMNQARYDEASQYLATALDLASACAARYQCALTRMAQAQLEVLRGNQAAAHAPLEESRAIFEELGASPALERTEELSVRIGASRKYSPSGLSSRELDVLALLVQGKSDRVIAEELFISPRTVMQHVARILRKLEVDSRTAAAVEAVRRELV